MNIFEFLGLIALIMFLGIIGIALSGGKTE